VLPGAEAVIVPVEEPVVVLRNMKVPPTGPPGTAMEEFVLAARAAKAVRVLPDGGLETCQYEMKDSGN
jgi:hypothetical protein